LPVPGNAVMLGPSGSVAQPEIKASPKANFDFTTPVCSFG
jgi:hypothetical protein